MTSQEGILVLGLGVSGKAAAELLCSEGRKVTVVDAACSENLQREANALRNLGVEVRLGEDQQFGDFELCIVSPGIAFDSAWIRELRSRGVRVISELEFGWARCAAKTLAVTGSNGKSTCVKLCHDALTLAGITSVMAGNCGLPFSAVAASGTSVDWILAEVSSFQLETVDQFRPDVGILLNILPNHLDRHGDMDAYTRLKSRLFRRMTEHDVGIVGADWLDVVRRESHGRCRWVSIGGEGPDACRFRDHELVWGENRCVDVRGTPFDNAVLGTAAAAAAVAVEACGAGAQCVAEATRGFEALPHRLEPVAARGGVAFVNDSKATNIAALDAALRTIDGPVRLIAGGRLKEIDVTKPKKVLASKVRAAYLIGEAMATLESEWRDVVLCRPCRTLDVAVEKAWLESEPGDTILLSPACASFDQFQSFEERGNVFVKCISQLDEEV
ncbi:MAG: UDP-N-acetylmuramoyl-L-alanine--D-glutamate ligase [Verrucomicrobia bacterium]|nr:UDP-N-acetylmuramoyl-L-alanine--D-glutamate ligase [Verrucomicrobiota bacterium]MDA1085826.1 UDP-N-acetylmuramoyl-L-alanine--D-glutamate ligase [Verrucomicrobiota bacterium]